MTMRSAGIVWARRQISSNGGAPLRTWQVADEMSHSPAHLLELFEQSLFFVLPVWHKRKWDNGRCWCHKVRCVIKLTDVREMYRSAKTPSQLLGDLDRLHRHFREIDWDDDVLNVQRFHAHNMKSLQLAGSALLAKGEPFLAL